MAVFFGGPDKLSAFLTRPTILGIVVDPCAAVLVFIITRLLCTGIKDSLLAQGIITTINNCSLAFHHSSWWIHRFQDSMGGYKVPGGYFPYGANRVLAGSATVFFSYDGFDAITSTAEEVKNPQRDVSTVVIGLVPCSQLDPDTLSPLLLLVME
ncbi:unnamed protein product [Lactuca saligna]|uniref:Amino acid permease/ SLC12A domain-containing protein n=1 Tax=Lactuca saligna TaxID=75948 RepID=A0AA36E8J8_LACSI|nr:unnamed protein product [Lactuca saligna]